MNISQEIELELSNSHNSSLNDISDLNIENNPSSFNDSLNNIKNNINIINNFSSYIKRKKNSYILSLTNYILYNEQYFFPILNYLNISELSNFRGVNHYLLNLIHKYYKIRFDIEIKSIINFQNKNEKLIISYMNHIDEQIPSSKNDWIDLNLQKNLNNLNILNQELINNIINSNIKIPDFIYKSLLIIIGFNDNDIIVDEDINWKKFSESILNTSNIMEIIHNIDYENINDNEIMKILNALNTSEFSINSIKEISEDYAKLILWFQSVVSFHLLVHPYIYRNNNGTIKPNSKEFFFAEKMEKKIEKFYKLKRFLIYLKIINIKIGEYVFTIQHSENYNKNNHNNSIKKKSYKKISYIYNHNFDKYSQFNDYKLIGNILSYIPFNESYKLMNVSKSFYNGFKYSIDILLFSIIKQIYFFRYKSYDERNEYIPIIFSNNFFSKFFLMLDDILNEPSGNNYELISKEVLNELKLLKSQNEYIIQISKILCELIGIKVSKKNDEEKKDYIGTIKMLAIKGELLKIMKNYNKIFFNQKKISSIYKQLKKFFDLKILKRIKSINRSVYCVLIWEIIFIQFLRMYNIFDFIDFEIINTKYNSQIEFIEFYLKLMENLRYILKTRFYFHIKNKNKKGTFYGIKEAINELINYLSEHKLTYKSDIILSSSNENFEMIGCSYFNVIHDKNNKFSHDILPFYERIINEIIIFYSENKNNIINNDYILNEENNKSKKSSRILRLDKNSTENINDNIENTNNKLTSNKTKYHNNTSYMKRITPNIKLNEFINKQNLFNNRNTYYETDTKKNNKLKKSKIIIIPDDIFIKTLFFYIDIKSLSKFGICNKKFLYCFKIHMLIRINYINTKKKIYELQNQDIINIINNKRKIFNSTYGINPPNKQHATKLINKLKIKDIQELKQYYKKYNKIYVAIISPFLLIIKDTILPKTKNNDNNKLSNFEIAKKILYISNNTSLIKKLNTLEIELIPSNIINKVDELLINNDYFKPEYMKNFNPSFSNVISWVIGIIELHKILRKYSVNIYDIETFDQKEIKFCKEMDDIILKYYKILRYTNYFCKDYEKDAKDIMIQMNLYE